MKRPAAIGRPMGRRWASFCRICGWTRVEHMTRDDALRNGAAHSVLAHKTASPGAHVDLVLVELTRVAIPRGMR